MIDRRSSVYGGTILFMALACLAILGLDLRQTWTDHDERLQEATIETSNLARSLAQHVQDVLETTDAELKTLSGAIAVDGRDPAAIQRLAQSMHARVANQLLFHSLFAFDQHGDWIASSRSAASFDQVRHTNYATRDLFRYHRDHAGDVTLIGLLEKSEPVGSAVVLISRRLTNPDGSFAGVVGGSIGIDLLQRFLGTVDIGRQGSIVLATGQGQILVRRPVNQNNLGRNITQSELFQTIRRDGNSGSFGYSAAVDGSARLASFHRIQDFGLIMVVTLDRTEVLASWWHEAWVHLAWLAITILFVLLLGYRLALQIRRRVAAEAIARKLQLETDQRQSAEAERRAYKAKLEEQKRELERSNAALEQFAYAASHDLQAPLRAIAHLAKWIDEDVRATASVETMENLNLLNGRVTRLQMLVRGLLAYARVGRNDPMAEDLDLAVAVKEIVDLLEPRPNFIVACEPGTPRIRTHRTPLELVLKNLISNALQHHDRTEGRVTIGMRLVDDMAEIRVSDDGPGIETRFHDEIFVIFRTLQRRDDTESGGIGLAMVKKQVTDYGGRIWVESAPPARGTTFVFTWKLATL